MKEESFNNVSFVYYVYTINFEQTSAILKGIDFKYPVYIDYKNKFFLENDLDFQKELQTFLVDEKDKVLLVGNPVYNPKIKELYINTIADFL
jgi:hypothetical protein